MANIAIEQAINGFELEFTDPKIEERNRQSKNGWENPRRRAVFKTKNELIKFLTDNIDKLCVQEDYSSAFDKALTEE